MELSEHKGAGNRYDMHLSAPAGGVAQMVRRPNGMWVTYEDYNHKCEQLKHVMDLVGALMVELDDTKAEANRLRASSFVTAVPVEQYETLKAEVERLKEGNDCLGQMHDKEMERSAWLREEFNRTTAWGRGLESDLSHARVEISFLKAEVERLTLLQVETLGERNKANAEVEQLQNRCDFLEGRNKE